MFNKKVSLTERGEKTMKTTKKPNLSHKLAAALTVGMATAISPTSVFAVGVSTKTFKDTTDAMVESSRALPNLITTTAFVAGIALAIAGVFKIKAHVDNPAQAPLKDGMIRLAVGGALIAFPLLTNLMVGAIGSDATQGHLVHTKIANLTY